MMYGSLSMLRNTGIWGALADDSHGRVASGKPVEAQLTISKIQERCSEIGSLVIAACLLRWTLDLDRLWQRHSSCTVAPFPDHEPS